MIEIILFCFRSFYVVVKFAVFWEVVNYREVYNLFVCFGILFNYEFFFRF